MTDQLSHFDKSGRAAMVDVTGKAVTTRVAIARSTLKISVPLTEILEKGTLSKGDAFTVAKAAAILAAKQTGNMIPMCHPLPVEHVGIEIELISELNEIRVEAQVSTTAKTGVEMEALMAASIAALTVYDMCKAVDKTIRIVNTGLYKKTGGKSGEFYNEEMSW